MESLVTWFRESWRKVWDQRKLISLHLPVFVAFGMVVFIATAVTVGIVGYVWFSSTISSRDEEIRIKNATIENLQNRSAASGPSSVPRSNYWEPLSSPEAATLRAKMRNMTKPPAISILCNDAGCFDLQTSFLTALEGLGWHERADRSMDTLESGISILTANEDYRPFADAIESATNGRLRVRFVPRITGWQAMDNEIHLAIGRK
jgi:hypothetical protein